MKKIIGLAAKARSGKDTVASIILDQSNATASAFADPVKVGCQSLFGLTTDEVWSDNTKESTIKLWDRSPRQLFQLVGTDWMRNHNTEHWLMCTQRAFSTSSPASIPSTQESLRTDLSDPKSAIKIATQAIFGLTSIQVWNPQECRKIDHFWGLSPIQMFNLLEKMALDTYPDYYDRRAQRPIQFPVKDVPNIAGDVAIIKDIRYENEADFIRNNGGKIWHISRDNAEKVNIHCSEEGVLVKEGDVKISNNGTLNELCIKITELCKKECLHSMASNFSSE